jgi:bacterioferritin-associated ferredoxin
MEQTTILCRCEDVTIDEIEEVVALGAATFDDVKRMTRCGMGPCQAKLCMNVGNNVISKLVGQPVSELPKPRVRIPLRMISMGSLASRSPRSSYTKAVFDEGDVHDK